MHGSRTDDSILTCIIIGGVQIRSNFDPSFQVSKGAYPISAWFIFDFWVSGTQLSRTWQSILMKFFSQVYKSKFHILFNLVGFDHSFGKIRTRLKRSLQTHVQNKHKHVHVKGSSCCSASKMRAAQFFTSLFDTQTHHGCRRGLLLWWMPSTVPTTTMVMSALTQTMWWLPNQELKAAVRLNRFTSTPAMRKRYCFCWALVSITTTNPCFPSNESNGLAFRRLSCVLATTTTCTKSSSVQICLTSILSHVQVTG